VAAIGVQIAHHKPLVVGIAREASILMNIQEMSTAAQYRSSSPVPPTTRCCSTRGRGRETGLRVGHGLGLGLGLVEVSRTGAVAIPRGQPAFRWRKPRNPDLS
jgi:hypothetical protein